MATSIYKIAEQAKYILGAGDMQPLIATVIDVYSSAVKKEWYENKADGFAEVDGTFIYTYGMDDSLVPILDLATDMYYIISPSSYLRLPGEYGVNYVGFIKGQSSPFVRIGSGSVGMWSNLKAFALGGAQVYYTENNRFYFPKMTNLTNKNIMLKLAIGLDSVDIDEEISIPRSVIDNIVNMVVAKFAPRKPEEEKVIV